MVHCPLLLSGARPAAWAALPRAPRALSVRGAAPLTDVACAGRDSCPPEQAAARAAMPTTSDVLAMTVSALAGRHDRPGTCTLNPELKVGRRLPSRRRCRSHRSRPGPGLPQ